MVDSGARVQYRNSTIVLSACTDLQPHMSQLCSIPATASVGINDTAIKFYEHEPTTRVSALNSVLTCVNVFNVTVPKVVRDPHGPDALYSPRCLRAIVSTGAQLLDALINLAEARPTTTTTHIFITANVSLAGLGLTQSLPPTVRKPGWFINVTSTLVLTGVPMPAGAAGREVVATAADRGLPSPAPELDFGGAVGFLSATSYQGSISLSRLVLTNMPTGALGLYPYGLVTSLTFWCDLVRSGSSLGSPMTGQVLARMVVRDVTMVVPSDEVLWYHRWFSGLEGDNMDWMDNFMVNEWSLHPASIDTHVQFNYSECSYRDILWYNVSLMARGGLREGDGGWGSALPFLHVAMCARLCERVGKGGVVAGRGCGVRVAG